VIIRGQFSDFFNETMLPALRATLWNEYDAYPTQFTEIFQIETSTRSIEQYSGVTGLGLFREIEEGEGISFDSPLQMFDKTFKHKRYGLGFKVSQDVVEDDKISLVTKQTKELAMSAKETQEIDAASTFNNAFTAASYAGPDGKALCASDHPLIKSGGSQSNILSVAADLDHTSLELALTDFEMMRDASGRLRHVPVKRVVVAPQNRFNVHEILKSVMRSDTANNTTNGLKYATDGMPDPFVWRYLTDPDAWFLTSAPGRSGLVWFWRRKPYTKAGTDDLTETGRFMMRYRKSHGFYTFYGVYGTPGA